MKAKLAYIAVAFVGLVMSYNTNIFQPEIVQASEIPKVITLPQPKGHFDMALDLVTGTVKVESNLPIASTDVTVNHPTKIVEKVVYKPGKERIAYDTIVVYREKVGLLFPIPPSWFKPKPKTVALPDKIERI